MRIARIEGADPRPLGAPSDWNEAENGRCGALFIRREVIAGVRYMRSAWEVDALEASHLAAGGKLILGIAGSAHPVVHLEVHAPDSDAEPTYLTRRIAHISGAPAARVDAAYPSAPDRRAYCEMILNGESFASAVAAGIEKCDAMAREAGWLR